MFCYQKILHVTVFFCLFSFNLSAQNIDFSDINLKSALLNHAPKVDMNNDNEISISEALAVTQLKLSKKNISSIEDLVVFENLKKLNIDTNNITTIPDVLFERLRFLSCTKNTISSLPAVVSTNLDSLYLNHNLINQANFSNTPNISNLHISNNPLHKLNVVNLEHLAYLYFDNTQIKTIDFSGLGNLKGFGGQNVVLDTLYANSGIKLIDNSFMWSVIVKNYNFSNNQDLLSINTTWISKTFNFIAENCTNLSTISFNNTDVENLSLNNCINLTSLRVEYNYTPKLKFLSLNNCSNLKELYLYQLYNGGISKTSEIYKLSELIKDCQNIEKIRLSNYVYEDFNFINDYTKLKEIQLKNTSNNGSISIGNLSELEIININGINNVQIKNCEKLTIVNTTQFDDYTYFTAGDSLIISNCNDLTSIAMKIKSLKVITCPKFTTFTSSSLENIWFDSCDAFTTFPGGWWNPNFKGTLKSLQVTNCKGIENLNISWPSSKINFINIDGSTNLKELHVAGHNLETVDLSTNTKLEKIFLQNNNLKSLNVSHLPNLNTLNIANNANLLYVDLNYDHQLAKLYISGMNKGFFACVDNPSDVNIDSVFVDADGIKRFYNCDTIVFKDKILEQVLLNFNPPIDTNKDGVISMFEAKNFTKLVLSDVGINFTDGLEFFRNLDTLILNNNYVQTFNATNFSGLQYLDLSSNILAHLILNREKSEITESTKDLVVLQQTLDSTYNSTLQTLLLNNNQLKELDVTKVVNLNYLNTQNNPLIGICVNQNQLDNWVNVWDKDAQAIWSTNCDEVTSSNYIQQNLAPAYPNPAQNYIYINAPATGILDINGKLVQNISINTKFITLQLSPGLYFIQYQNGKVEKLIVQ